jgi:hypothetical protein
MQCPDHPSLAPMRFSAVEGMIDPDTGCPTVAVVSIYYPTRILARKNSTPEQKIKWVCPLIPQGVSDGN